MGLKNTSTQYVRNGVAALILLLPVLAFAQVNDSNREAAQRLAEILKNTDTLSAEVEQLTLDQDGREIQEFRARLILDKPDHFYWEILSPYSEIMLTDGERIWRFEPDLDQVTIDLFQDDINRTPVLLLNGDAEAITAAYTIAAADFSPGAEGESKQRFILHPKAPDSLFERLSLTFAGNALEEMQFEDSLGQKTSLTFTALELNTEIDPSIFVFRMPDGVEVIDNSGG